MSDKFYYTLEQKLDGYSRELIANMVSVDIGYATQCLIAEFEHYASTESVVVATTNSPHSTISNVVTSSLSVFLSRPRDKPVREIEIETLLGLISNELRRELNDFMFEGVCNGKDVPVKVNLRGVVFKDMVEAIIVNFKHDLSETIKRILIATNKE